MAWAALLAGFVVLFEGHRWLGCLGMIGWIVLLGEHRQE